MTARVDPTKSSSACCRDLRARSRRSRPGARRPQAVAQRGTTAISPPTLRLLGPVELGSSTATVSLGGPKQQAVLALLACAGRAVSADRLIAQLWAEGPAPSKPKRTLHVYVSTLRKALAPFGLRIVGSGQDYRLEGPRELVDLCRFEDLLTRAGELAPRRPDRALAVYDEADRLWRGTPFSLLPDLDDLVVAAICLTSRQLSATEARLELAIEYGDLDDAVGELERFVAEHPLRERAVAALMLGRYRQGRQTEALAAYTDVRHALGEELGLDPSPALRELERQILLHTVPSPRAAARPHAA